MQTFLFVTWHSWSLITSFFFGIHRNIAFLRFYNTPTNHPLQTLPTWPYNLPTPSLTTLPPPALQPSTPSLTTLHPQPYNPPNPSLTTLPLPTLQSSHSQPYNPPNPSLTTLPTPALHPSHPSLTILRPPALQPSHPQPYNPPTPSLTIFPTPALPSLRPPGFIALLSPGQVFLFTVMAASSHTLSTREPSIPRGLRSTRTRWLSVPPGSTPP